MVHASESHMNINQEIMIAMTKDDISLDSTKFSKINEQASHHRHRLSQSSNKDGSRTMSISLRINHV
jgi:hypothetical protein